MIRTFDIVDDEEWKERIEILTKKDSRLYRSAAREFLFQIADAAVSLSLMEGTQHWLEEFSADSEFNKENDVFSIGQMTPDTEKYKMISSPCRSSDSPRQVLGDLSKVSSNLPIDNPKSSLTPIGSSEREHFMTAVQERLHRMRTLLRSESPNSGKNPSTLSPSPIVTTSFSSTPVYIVDVKNESMNEIADDLKVHTSLDASDNIETSPNSSLNQSRCSVVSMEPISDWDEDKQEENFPIVTSCPSSASSTRLCFPTPSPMKEPDRQIESENPSIMKPQIELIFIDGAEDTLQHFRNYSNASESSLIEMNEEPAEANDQGINTLLCSSQILISTEADFSHDQSESTEQGDESESSEEKVEEERKYSEPQNESISIAEQDECEYVQPNILQYDVEDLTKLSELELYEFERTLYDSSENLPNLVVPSAFTVSSPSSDLACNSDTPVSTKAKASNVCLLTPVLENETLEENQVSEQETRFFHSRLEGYDHEADLASPADLVLIESDDSQSNVVHARELDDVEDRPIASCLNSFSMSPETFKKKIEEARCEGMKQAEEEGNIVIESLESDLAQLAGEKEQILSNYLLMQEELATLRLKISGTANRVGKDHIASPYLGTSNESPSRGEILNDSDSFVAITADFLDSSGLSPDIGELVANSCFSSDSPNAFLRTASTLSTEKSHSSRKTSRMQQHILELESRLLEMDLALDEEKKRVQDLASSLNSTELERDDAFQKFQSLSVRYQEMKVVKENYRVNELRFQEELRCEQSRREDAENKFEKLREVAQEQLTKATDDARILRDQLLVQCDRIKTLESELSASQSLTQSLQLSLSASQEKVQKLEHDMQCSDERLRSLEETKNLIRPQLDRLRQELSEKSQVNVQLTAENIELRSEVSDIRDQLLKLQSERTPVDKLWQEIAERDSKIALMESELEVFRLSTEKNSVSTGQDVSALPTPVLDPHESSQPHAISMLQTELEEAREQIRLKNVENGELLEMCDQLMSELEALKR